jgi:predicted CXXCH cytochrome family protein
VRWHSWVAGILALALLAGGVVYFVRGRSAATPVVESPATRTSASGNRYVDPSVCADCHSDISDTYARTAMGRSFSRPTAGNTIGDTKDPATFYHKASDSYFMMLARDGKFYQRRYQIGFDGKETNSLEKEIHYVMGSGNHARAYLHRSARNTLVELPLGWYEEGGGSWAMSPGYDRPDHAGFTRPVTYGCMFCHNGIPEIPSAANSRAEPVFDGRVPEGIDCQRCHGPGSNHVQAAETAGVNLEDVRKAIVNPARLEPERRMEVCMQCHLQTTSFPLPNSIVRYDRDPFSFRPGEALADFMLHFDHAPGAGREDKFEIAGAAYRLRRSACFLKSDGALGCTTCHNPHDTPRGEAAATHYRTVCRQCHGADFTELVDAGKHSRDGDCIGCHMPKRRTDDVVHAVMTDHYIQRRKPSRNLLAPLAERHETAENAYRGEVVLYYPRTASATPDQDLYLAVAQVSQKTNLAKGAQDLAAAIEKHRPQRVEFYLHLGEALKDSGQLAKALPVYEEAVRRQPDSLIALQRLGFALRSAGQLGRAAETLKRALALDSRDAASWHQLGLVYLGQGSPKDALSAFQKTVEADPDMSEGHNSLGGLWLESGDLPRAEPALREAIRIQPDYAEARSNLANVLASTNRLAEARHHFEAALRLKPDYAAARFNYGVALAKSGRLDEALPHFRRVAESSDAAMRERAVNVLRQLQQRR